MCDEERADAEDKFNGILVPASVDNSDIREATRDEGNMIYEIQYYSQIKKVEFVHEDQDQLNSQYEYRKDSFLFLAQVGVQTQNSPDQEHAGAGEGDGQDDRLDQP